MRIVTESKKCLNCEKVMSKPSNYSYFQWKNKKHCSLSCGVQRRKTGEIKKCLSCEKEFYHRPKEKGGKYCSKSCSAKNTKNSLGKHWKVEDTSNMKNKIISEKTKEIMSIAQYKRWSKIERKEAPRYRHNINREYKKWRSDVFTRDNWTCQTCRIRGVYLEAHHIKSYARFPELRLELNNGVTLCRECHKMTDNYKGKNKKSENNLI